MRRGMLMFIRFRQARGGGTRGKRPSDAAPEASQDGLDPLDRELRARLPTDPGQSGIEPAKDAKPRALTC